MSFADIVGKVNGFAWGPIMLVLLVGTGVYLSIRVGFIQFSRIGYWMRNTFGKLFKKQNAGEGEVTPLQAVTTALAATVGTGNIVGTSQAIALGGYGAVFWLWIAALVGMVTKYSEVTLAVKYRERDDKGDWVGGPMYYIKNGMGKGWGWLAILFSLFAALASFGIGNMSQVNSITGSVIGAVQQFTTVPEETAVIMRWVIGGVLALLIGVILIGGIKRIGSVTEKLIPFMSLLYIIFTLVVIFGNIGMIGDAFGKIFSTAFTPQAMFGASTGIVLRQTIVWGLRRSAFSNEAGLGSAAIAHAATSEKDPVKQGLYGIFEVFMDTIVICSMTALVILTTGVLTDNPDGLTGARLTLQAFERALGEPGKYVLSVGLLLFAFTTILGWYWYAETAVTYLLGVWVKPLMKVLWIVMILVGAAGAQFLGAAGNEFLNNIWDISDTLNGLMALPNLIGLLLLSFTLRGLVRDYDGRRKRGEL